MSSAHEQTIGSAILSAQERFADASETPRLDAELLLAFCLKKPRSYLYSWPERHLSIETQSKFRSMIDMRLKPTPIAYLLGEREFYSLSFHSNSNALIPRPETELLVETVIQLCTQYEHPNVLEMGTGTGIISITLKKYCPNIELLTTDISIDCLTLANDNAQSLGVSLQCLISDWYSGISEQLKFDIIVSNPPYIAADDPYLKLGDLPAEPLQALTPGDSGLEAIEQIIAQAPEHLNSGGYLAIEHGYDQAPAIDRLLTQNGFSHIRQLRDDSEHPRVSMGQLLP